MRILAWPAFNTRNGNPYNWLLSSRLQELGIRVDEFSPAELAWNRYDLWHIHWPEHFLNQDSSGLAAVKIHVLAGMMQWARTRGTKIVWTVHNLCSHEQHHPSLEPYFWNIFTRMLDGYICLSDNGKQMASQVFPALRDIPGFVIPHGHYREEYPDTFDKQAARANLGLPADGHVILYFGGIRPYKNVPALMRAFRDLSTRDTVLCIAGYAPSETLRTEIQNEAARDSRVKLVLGWASRQQVQMLFAAADLVALPLLETLNSGSAMLALSLNRPVLVPSLGAMPELRDQVGAEWVRTYCGDVGADELERGLEWAEQTPRSVIAPLSSFDWGHIAQRTTEAYNTVISAGLPA